jgi:hypothetical protein
MIAALFKEKDYDGFFGPTDKLRSIVRDGSRQEGNGGYSANNGTGCVKQQKTAGISPASRLFNNKAGKTGKPGATAPKQGGANDGLLGSLLMQCLVGAPLLDAFSQAMHMPVAADPAEIGHIIDFCDELMTDRAKPRPAQAAAPQNFRLCEGGHLGGIFNRRPAASPAKGYMPARENGEEALLRSLVAASGQGTHAVSLRLRP